MGCSGSLVVFSAASEEVWEVSSDAPGGLALLAFGRWPRAAVSKSRPGPRFSAPESAKKGPKWGSFWMLHFVAGALGMEAFG